MGVGLQRETEATAFSGRILPDKEEGWRRFLQELEGSRRDEYEAMRRRLGVCAGMVWLYRSRHGTAVVAYLEAEDPREVIRRLAESGEPFEMWFKERLLEFHGLDLSGVRPGRVPELVFACGGKSDNGRG